MNSLALLLIMAPSGDTCGEYRKASKEVREAYVAGLSEGDTAGKFVIYRTIMEHGLAGKDSSNFVKTLSRITDDKYPLGKVEAMTHVLDKLCAGDMKGKVPMFLMSMLAMVIVSGDKKAVEVEANKIYDYVYKKTI